MLDTGIDVPEVVNLVFFKLVRSKTKFWQMVGRGTRLCLDLFGPDQHKEFFYLFDYCQNLAYFSQDIPGTEGYVADSLAKRLFDTRLELISSLDQRRETSTATGLKEAAATYGDPKTEDEITRPASEDAPFSALVFKVMSDPYVGKLTYFRVYSGHVKAGDRVLNTTNGRTERIGRILQMHANHREEREEIGAGEIAAAVGLKQSTTGDTLAVESAPIVLESMTFPDPVISVAIEPKTKGDQDKLGQGLQRLAEEDPTFRVSTDEETGQTLIAGMGELHLEIIVDRLMREFKVDANVGRPQVAYRETASQPVYNVQGRFVRQTGGSGQYGDVVINLLPQEPGAGYEFEDKIVGGKIPKEYIKPVDDGIQEAMGAGVLAGYPVVDVKIELVEGSYHEVDSSERAFKIAGSMAFKEAMKRAKPKLLEPTMAVEVVTPEEYLGDVMGNLNSRRGRVEHLEPLGNSQTIKASVPLSEMFGYATDLRSMTQGRATFTMQFDRYEDVPVTIAETIVTSNSE